MRIKIRQSGELKKTFDFLNRVKSLDFIRDLDELAKEGVEALRSATPVDTGKTANSWSYVIEKSNNKITIKFTNSNVVNGVPIAVILQYGHGTGTGGYVQGIDYINPALKPIFDKMLESAWRRLKNG